MDLETTTAKIAELVNAGMTEDAKGTLISYVKQPWLGLTTTGELKAELAARGPESPDDYKTAQ